MASASYAANRASPTTAALPDAAKSCAGGRRTLLRLSLDRGYDPHLELTFDFPRGADLPGVGAGFLERAFEADLLGGERNSVVLEGRGDLDRPDATVEVAVFGGVRLDRDALLGDFGGQLPQLGFSPPPALPRPSSWP